MSFRYDPLGRRISKTSQQLLQGRPSGNAATTRFVWEGYRLLQEIHDGTPLTYVYSDSQSYEPLARIDGVESPEIYWFHNAANGMPELLTDAEGQKTWEGINSPWGKLLRESSQRLPAVQQNLRMQGQYLDRETGLHYNLFRYYDPDSGRFTQQDPIGLAGGINLYEFAPNAINWIDPLGLSKCSLASKMVKAVNGRMPINSKFSGKMYPIESLPVVIRHKYPHSVPFNHAGFPDFTRYSIRNVRIELGRTRAIDFARADKAAGYGRGNPRPNDYTWHHHQDSGYMQLIPTDIHAAVKHTGGIATGK